MFKRPLLPGLVWTLFIAVLTLAPGNYIPRVVPFLDWLGPDKIVHFFLFGTYSFLLMEGFKRQNKYAFPLQYTVFTTLLIGIVFGVLTEVMQKFVIPGRNGNIYDMLADIIGSLLGVVAWIIIRRNEKKNLRSSKNKY